MAIDRDHGSSERNRDIGIKAVGKKNVAFCHLSINSFHVRTFDLDQS